MNFLFKKMIKHPALIALAATCFLTAALTSGTLLASPQSAPKQASHVAESTEGQWLKHAANGSNAEIMMPAKPRMSERTFRPVADEPFIKVTTWLCTANQNKVLFKLSYHDLHQQPVTRKQIKNVLDGSVKGAVAQVIGNMSDTVEDTKVRTYPGRKFTYEFMLGEQKFKSDTEVYLIGKRQYMLNTIFAMPHYRPELSRKFFETFNPFDPEDSTLAAGDIDANASTADSPSTGFDGLTLPSGEEPVRLK